MAACSKKEAPEPEPVIPVQVAEVETAAIERTVVADGVLFPSNQSAVMPKISAPVREFLVNRGDRVHKGQLLAVLENKDLAAAKIENQGLVKQAEAAYRNTTAASLPEEIEKARLDLQSASQALEAADKLYEGRKELLREGAIARRLVDEANVAFVQAKAQQEIAARHLEALQKVAQQAQVSSAEGQLEAAKGRFEGAEAQLQYSEIRSPIDGVVTDRQVYAGEMATPGTPLLTIMDVSKLIARANVPTSQLRYVKVGNNATVTAPDGTIADGKVTVVSPAVDPNSTTAEVWALLENARGHLRPGETVRASIQTGKIPDAIVVPTAALVPTKDGSDSVMVADSSSVAHERRVIVGVRGREKSQILEGIKSGERVIIEGALGLQDNAKVLVQTAGKHE
jgi:multidrug efflux pump subunit AcrA (membrane-fusion protein)